VIVVADFNGDGKLDLAVGRIPGPISILLGNGDGTFGAATSIPTTGVASLAVGDFNGDGKLDLAVGRIPGPISILLGNGDGTFGTGGNFPVERPSSIAAGDLNGDSKLDIIVSTTVTSAFLHEVSVLLGNGDGTLGAATGFPLTQHANSVAVGDFNGDGKLDVVTAVPNANNASIFLGNGDGTLGAAVGFPVGGSPYSGAVGDFNKDGKLDFVTADPAANGVKVLLGNGDGTLGAAAGFPVGGSAYSVAVEDFNKDGKLDVVTANLFENSAGILLGNGDGTFGTEVSFSVGAEPSSVAVGDFNRDGKPDVATVAYLLKANSVSVLLNATDRTQDTTAPALNCGNPDGFWHASDVSIACTAQDADSGLADPADANFLLTTSVPPGTETSNAATGTRTVCDIGGNCATAGPIVGNKVDKKAPTVNCLHPDEQWHSGNLSVGCMAADGGSGLAAAPDANFSLTTHVANGTESSNAMAVPRNVCDAVSNCTPATVPGGIKVDRKPPSIVITSPEAARYQPNQEVAASYSCADGGSGVAVCIGPVPSGNHADTGPPSGAKTFTVFAVDRTGNVSSKTVTYQVGNPDGRGRP